jgi:hypothetical protein
MVKSSRRRAATLLLVVLMACRRRRRCGMRAWQAPRQQPLLPFNEAKTIHYAGATGKEIHPLSLGCFAVYIYKQKATEG